MSAEGRHLVLFLAGVSLLYGAGLNPWLMPESTDDIIYFELARSHAAGDGHRFQGEVIGDWPPVFPLYLSIPMRFGVESILVAKLMVMVAALVALFLAGRLIRREGREFPRLTLLLTAVFPTAFAYAVRTSSDWFFAALSFGFLLLLHGMREGRPSWWKGLLLGVLLGAAALTREIGVLLGAAIVTQVGWRWWDRTKSRGKGMLSAICRSWPELAAALIGAGIWFGWKVYLDSVGGELAKGNYDQRGLEMWKHFEPLRLLEHVGEVWIQFSNVAGILGLPAVLQQAILAAFGLLLVLGVLETIRSRRFQPSDAYAIATIALILPYLFKTPRFWIILSPFLLSWFFRGLGVCLRPAAGKVPAGAVKWIPRLGGAGWVAGCVAICLVLVTRGNAHHAALSPILTSGEEEFYRGYYADLRAAGARAARIEPKPERAGIDGWFANSFHVWSGGVATFNWEFYPREIDWFVASPEDPGVPPEVGAPGDFEPIVEEGEVTIYARKPRE